jgi:hypothetical protein
MLAPVDLVQVLCDAFVAAIRWKIHVIPAFFPAAAAAAYWNKRATRVLGAAQHHGAS